MKKRLIIAFLFVIFILPFFASAKAENIPRYVETYDHEAYYDTTYRTYNTKLKLRKQFSAPNGTVVLTDVSDSDITSIVNDIVEVTDNGLLDMISIKIDKTVEGISFYYYSDSFWTVESSDSGTKISSVLQNQELLNAQDIVLSQMIGAKTEIEIYPHNDDSSVQDKKYVFKFDFEEIEVGPIEYGDLVELTCDYYIGKTEQYYTLKINPNPELFDVTYGLTTDGKAPNPNYPYAGPELLENYTAYLYMHGTNNVGKKSSIVELDNLQYGWQIPGIPDKKIEYHIVVEFDSGGDHYAYRSNSIIVEPIEYQILLDKYDNRTSVGAETTHELSLVTSVDEKLGGSYNYEWDAVDIDYKMQKFIFEENTFDYKFKTLGNQTISVKLMQSSSSRINYYIESEIKINVSSTEPKHINPNDAITISYDEYPFEVEDKSKLTENDYLVNTNEEQILLLEGSKIDYLINIDPDALSSNPKINYKVEALKSDIVKIDLTDNKITIDPRNEGVTTIRITISSNTFDEIVKEFKVRVISYIGENKTLSINTNDNKKYTLSFNIGEYNKILNIKPNWQITNANIINNGNGTITFTKTNNEKCQIKANILTFDALEYEVEEISGTIKLDGFTNRFDAGKNAYHEYSYANNAYQDVEYKNIYWKIDDKLFYYGKTNENYEDVSLKFVENNPFITKIMINTSGKHTIICGVDLIDSTEYVNRTINNETKFELNVLDEEPTRTDVSKYVKVSLDGNQYNVTDDTTAEDLLIDFEKENVLLLEGGELNLVASIDNQILEGAKPNYEWSIDNAEILGFDPDNNTLIIKPLKAGLATITIKVQADTIGVVEKKFDVKVICYREAEKEIYVDDLSGFHKSGSDVVAYFMVDGYTNILNAKINWSVFSDGEEPVAIDYVKNPDGSVTLKDYEEGKYTIKANFSNNGNLECSIKFADIDYNALAKKWIPILATIALILCVAFLSINSALNGKTKIQEGISEAISIINVLDVEEEFDKNLKKAKNILKSTLSKANNINLKKRGQFDNVIEKLRKAVLDLKNLCNDKAMENTVKMDEVNKLMKEQILPVYRLAKDVEKALVNSSESQKKAKSGTITVDNSKKK